MLFSTPLVSGTLLKRHKRFLAECRLGDGREVTAHCANPGSMMGLAEPGTWVWLEPNDDPKKKLKYGWRLIEHDSGHLTGVDTSVPNRVVGEALDHGAIPELAGYDNARAEVPYADRSRIDFLLTGKGRADTYVEIKSVTLSRKDGVAEFPDSVTARGTRHLRDLAGEAGRGNRAVLLYLVQRTDTREVTVARDIDPAYAQAFDEAMATGVEVLCYRASLTPRSIGIDRPLPLRV